MGQEEDSALLHPTSVTHGSLVTREGCLDVLRAARGNRWRSCWAETKDNLLLLKDDRNDPDNKLSGAIDLTKVVSVDTNYMVNDSMSPEIAARCFRVEFGHRFMTFRAPTAADAAKWAQVLMGYSQEGTAGGASTPAAPVEAATVPRGNGQEEQLGDRDSSASLTAMRTYGSEGWVGTYNHPQKASGEKSGGKRRGAGGGGAAAAGVKGAGQGGQEVSSEGICSHVEGSGQQEELAGGARAARGDDDQSTDDAAPEKRSSAEVAEAGGDVPAEAEEKALPEGRGLADDETPRVIGSGASVETAALADNAGSVDKEGEGQVTEAQMMPDDTVQDDAVGVASAPQLAAPLVPGANGSGAVSMETESSVDPLVLVAAASENSSRGSASDDTLLATTGGAMIEIPLDEGERASEALDEKVEVQEEEEQQEEEREEEGEYDADVEPSDVEPSEGVDDEKEEEEEEEAQAAKVADVGVEEVKQADDVAVRKQDLAGGAATAAAATAATTANALRDSAAIDKAPSMVCSKSVHFEDQEGLPPPVPPKSCLPCAACIIS